MRCPVCHSHFTPAYSNQKFCSTFCYRKHKYKELQKQRAIDNATPQKSLAEWCREAKECGLDYGNYRALINTGKTFEELKARAESRGISIHSCTQSPS